MTWKEIPDFPGYEVSDEGEVRSYKRSRSPRILKPTTQGSKRQYKAVCLYQDGKKCMRSVHQLVALAFLGPNPDGLEIRHLDSDPSNNNLSNLCYGTRKENRADRLSNGTYGTKLTEVAVRLMRKLHKLGFPAKRLMEIFRVSRPCVNKVTARERWANVV